MATEEQRPVKRRRLLDESTSSSPTTAPATPPEEMDGFPKLDRWPDDIIVHFLQFLDCETLQSFYSTCRRTHFFVRRNLKSLLDPIVASLPLTDEIQHLLDVRSQLLPSTVPPRPSFGYIHLHKRTYSDFQAIAEATNPVKTCPRATVHGGIDLDFLQPSVLHFFRSSYCYYFSNPLESIARFWTIFWEFKRVKAEDPEGFREKVAEWAWKRYSYRDILGVARFNGSYYSRIITTSLNCQRDALRMVLEIYKSRTPNHETWNVEDGVPSLHWNMSLSRNSESEYRTGQIPPGIER
jgi:hypothetical protein